MKKGVLFFSFILFAFYSFTQSPGVKWTNNYHAQFDNLTEASFDMKITSKKDFILAGCDSSFQYSKADFLKKYVKGWAWLVKVDQDGNILWRRPGKDGDPYYSSYTAIQIGVNDTIIAVGHGIVGGSGDQYYIAKYDSSGNRVWYKTYGGLSGDSRATCVQITADGGYIVGGTTTSNDGDVSGNHNAGTEDVWILKLDVNGNVQWKKCYGGTGADSAYAILQSPDNGFVVVGSSTSSDGDLTGNNGLSDGWIFKIDNSGTLVWEKNIGGANDEDFKNIILNSDSSYTLIGATSSTTITDNTVHGKSDLWVLKIKDDAGQILWSKSFGGSQDDQGYSIQRTIGNGYLISGYTESSDGDVSGNNGQADAWLIRLTADGDLTWQKCVGTNKDDFGMQALYLDETNFAMSGFAEPLFPNNSVDYTDASLSRLGDANVIKGFLYVDANLNGSFDVNETAFNEAIVKTQKPGGLMYGIPQNGLFNLSVDTGTYTTSVQVNVPYYNVTPTSTSSTFLNYFNTDSFSFAVQPTPGIKDMVISAIPLERARSGFPLTYKIFYKNIGTDVISNGEVLFKYDSRLDFISADQTVTSTNGDTLRWSFSNLEPFDTASITLYFDVPIPPTVNILDTLVSVAIIDPVSGDLTPHDDTSYIKQVVYSAVDPNGKYENNEGEINLSDVANGKYLDYTIYFQNTGIDTAFNVIVTDTLSTKVDWNTLELITSSHACLVNILDQNILKFTFNNINLPDSNVNEPGSHGYVSFRIKPLNSISVGDTIHNTSSVYFDYNLPVETNDAFTVIKNNFVVLPLTFLSFTGVYRNDHGILYWSTANEINVKKFLVERSLNGSDFSVIGEEPALSNNSNYQFDDNLSNETANSFYYRIKEVDADNKIKYSNVILLRRIMNSLQISVNPNPANNIALLTIVSDRDTNVRINIFDVNGKIVLNQSNVVYQGNNTILINNLSPLKQGYYTITVYEGINKFSLPLMIVR